MRVKEKNDGRKQRNRKVERHVGGPLFQRVVLQLVQHPVDDVEQRHPAAAEADLLQAHDGPAHGALPTQVGDAGTDGRGEHCF